MMKLMIIGHARHGKDEVAGLLARHHGYTFGSSSMFCAKKFIHDALRPLYGYKTIKECFEDRSRHRAEWYNLIGEYNKDDPTRLVREIFEQYDIYAGCRNPDEFWPSKKAGLFDYAVWVDASKRKPAEDTSSNRMTIDMADYVINNNGPRSALLSEVNKMIGALGKA